MTPSKWAGFALGLGLLIAGIVLSSQREVQDYEKMQGRLNSTMKKWRLKTNNSSSSHSSAEGQHRAPHTELLLGDEEDDLNQSGRIVKNVKTTENYDEHHRVYKGSSLYHSEIEGKSCDAPFKTQTADAELVLGS